MSWFLAAVDGMRRAPKHQAPNAKLQRSSKSQAPNQGLSDVVAILGGALRFGAWNFSGAWSLGFEAFQPSHSTETARNHVRRVGAPINRFADAIKRIENNHLVK